MRQSLALLLTVAASLAMTGCVQQRTVSPAPHVATPTDPATFPAPGDALASGPRTPSGAPSCDALGSLGPRFDAPVNRENFDPVLFDQAVTHLTNRRRCESGLAPLAADPGLRRVAEGHSRDMARLNFYGHTSPVRGRSRMIDRYNASGLSYRAAAENLGLHSRLRIVSGRPFTVLDRASCAFAYDGQTIQPHSYRTLAEEFVRSWVSSPEHSRNLLGSQYTRVGSGASFKDNVRNCGDFVATQNFAA